MNTLRDALSGLAVIIALVVVVAFVVVGLATVMQRETQAEIDFRAACAAAKGITVWNSRHWECIK